ncbi:MAG: DUF4325 domain-containing protein [Patescibacteria group bacterium]
MNIKLKKFGTTLTSRQAGKEAFAAFQPSLGKISEQEDILIDFEEVVTFSPSWGDEFLTPLANLFGERLKLMRSENPSVKTSLEIIEESNMMKFHIVNVDQRL